jgi:hypothetical protein
MSFFKIVEPECKTSFLEVRGIKRGEEIKKGYRWVKIVDYCVLMYVSGKRRPDISILGIGGG